MPRIVLAIFLPICLLATLASGQSLAEAARAARAKKNPTPRPNERVYTNESLGLLTGKMTTASVSNGTASTPATTDAAKPDPAKADASAAKPAAETKDEAAAADEKKKQLAEDISKTKSEVEQLTRELDVLQRENRLRAAAYYADAGNRLRDERKYAEEDRRYQQDIQSKQSALTAAKQKLDTLNEEARRSGAR
jgi:chromosome segregation ATPase